MLCAFALRADSNCVDIGAHRGDLLRHILRAAPHGHHIAYEPLPDHHARLVESFPTVDARNAAVWNDNGTMTFEYVRSEPAQSGLKLTALSKSAKTASIQVRTDRLDDSLPDGYVPDLIKVDVEGAERQVFEGALRTLGQHKPIVFFEHQPEIAAAYGSSPADIHALLVGEVGLQIFTTEGTGPLTALEFAQLSGGRMHNFIART